MISSILQAQNLWGFHEWGAWGDSPQSLFHEWDSHTSPPWTSSVAALAPALLFQRRQLSSRCFSIGVSGFRLIASVSAFTFQRRWISSRHFFTLVRCQLFSFQCFSFGVSGFRLSASFSASAALASGLPFRRKRLCLASAHQFRCKQVVTPQFIGFVVSDFRLSTSVRRQRLSHQRISFGVSSVRLRATNSQLSVRANRPFVAFASSEMELRGWVD